MTVFRSSREYFFIVMKLNAFGMMINEFKKKSQLLSNRECYDNIVILGVEMWIYVSLMLYVRRNKKS